ncbi:hypothetical protein DWV56_07680 [Holdemanella biformis]|uniref:C_GCAxxG_C_C family protein n=2 Tax=Holdemanella biformis TaxID=1735 RepID=A0A413CTA9_9FIRM|nr:hypothetical protein DWV56_07680 [Holdemanella biformis]
MDGRKVKIACRRLFMTILEENVKKYYQSGYNCSETLLHACNESYQLDISEEDMKMMAGFGGGMFIGSTCGALVGSIAALSKMVCKTKAHDMLPELRPLIQKHTRNFKELLGNLDCAHIKPLHHSTDPNIKCMNTCLLAAKALEKTMEEEHLL